MRLLLEKPRNASDCRHTVTLVRCRNSLLGAKERFLNFIFMRELKKSSKVSMLSWILTGSNS